MAPMEIAEDLIKELGVMMDLDGLTLSDGSLTLQLDDKLEISIGLDVLSPQLIIFGLVQEAKGPWPVDILEGLLASHYLGACGKDVSLAIEPLTRSVVLQHFIPLEGLTCSALYQQLEHFTKLLNYWIVTVSEALAATAVTTDTQPTKTSVLDPRIYG